MNGECVFGDVEVEPETRVTWSQTKERVKPPERSGERGKTLPGSAATSIFKFLVSRTVKEKSTLSKF